MAPLPPPCYAAERAARPPTSHSAHPQQGGRTPTGVDPAPRLLPSCTVLSIRSGTTRVAQCARESAERESASRGSPPGCYCYIKMSWGNCSVEMSSRHGDFHDEPEGVTPRGAAHRGGGTADQQWGGGGGPAHHGPAVSAAQTAVPRDRGRGAAPSRARAAVTAAAAGERGGSGAGALARPLCRVQRHSLHRKAAGGARAGDLARVGPALTPGTGPTRRAPPAAAEASQSPAAGGGGRAVAAARWQPLRLARGARPADDLARRH